MSKAVPKKNPLASLLFLLLVSISMSTSEAAIATQQSGASPQQSVGRSSSASSSARRAATRASRRRAAARRRGRAQARSMTAAKTAARPTPVRAAAPQPSAATLPLANDSTLSTTTPAPLSVDVPLPATLPLPASVDPFAAIEHQEGRDKTYNVKFARTPLDTKSTATAKVVLRGQTLLVRMRAKQLPQPTQFDVPRYALWVYIPNYRVKLYIGDLPITPTNSGGSRLSQPRGRRSNRTVRGNSDSAYRFKLLLPDAEYGGLMLTAEPVRYTPIVNEALRPLLVSLVSKKSAAAANAAPAIYSGPIPAGVK